MKKTVLALLIGGALSLGGCTPGGLEDLTAKIKQAQEYAKAACAFVPTVETVASIFAAGQFKTAFDAANAICTAVSKVSAKRGAAPRVSGVTVRGHFVRR